jgi:tetratricopeptide (TPR) repeat protein
MNRLATLAALLLSTALISSSASLAVPDPDVSELFDPAAIRRNLCGGTPGESARDRYLQYAAAAPTPPPAAEGRPALRKGFSNHTYPVTTRKPEAQVYFDQGLRLMYAFNHGEAVLSFQAAQEIDPTCAMCFWGESIALGPNINFEMSNRAHLQALIAIAAANKVEDGVTPRERALIDAAKTRYSADAKTFRAQLDAAYMEAMAKVHADFPDDPDIAALFAEAAMDATRPWWMPSGRVAVGRMAEAVTALEGALHAHPDHPGAMHYYLHVMEGTVWMKVAEPYADRLATLMPAAGHIVHMPSHIYFPLGRYKDSLTANLAAIKADEDYFASVATFETNYYALFAHNLHFGLQSATMAGDAVNALALAAKLKDSLPDDLMRAKFATQRNAAAAVFAHLRFDTPDTILALPKPDGDFTFLVAFWHYAQGTAHALNGDAAKAEAEANTLAGYRDSPDIRMIGVTAKAVPKILAVAEHMLRARIKGAQGKWAEAVQPLTQAVAVEDELGWEGDPPWWDNPLRQSLGIAQLRAGQPRDAVDTLRKALIQAPNDGVVLFALQQAAAATGDKAAAAEYGKLFKKAWAGRQPPDLNRL